MKQEHSAAQGILQSAANASRPSWVDKIGWRVALAWAEELGQRSTRRVVGQHSQHLRHPVP
jgi:hypothetical protein